MIQLAIIEDEPANARMLTQMLEASANDIQVMICLETVSSAVDWLQENQHDCDLLLMDISLSDGLSFEIFERMKVTRPVIFITAYEEYALKAFKANGIDYILKPFDREDIHRAIQRFLMIVRTPEAPDKNDLRQVLEKIKVQSGFKKSFLVHFRNKLIPLNTESIQWFYSKDEHVSAHTIDGIQYAISETLEILQQQLDPIQFFRVNRQYIINRKAILEVAFYFNGRLHIKASPAPGEQMLVSKARVPEFKKWMNS